MLKFFTAWMFFGAAVFAVAQTPAVIPATWVKGLVYVTCSIGKSGPLNCLFDTGSTMTGVSPVLTARLNLATHLDPNAVRMDIADKMLEPLPVTVGAITWTAQPVSILPKTIEALDHSSGEKTDVVIGTSMFQNFQVTVDPELKQVRIEGSGTPVNAGLEKMPLLVANGIGITFLGIRAGDGRLMGVPFTVDTGSMAPLLLGRPYWDAHPGMAVSNVHGPGNSLLRIDSVHVGRFDMQSVPAGEPIHEDGILSVKALGGMLGAPILNRFIVTYDFSQKAMWLKPIAGFDQAFPEDAVR